jgi:hypothetical protein
MSFDRVAAFLALLLLAPVSFAASCWPAQIGGTGTPAAVRVNSSAWALAWGCSDQFTQTLYVRGAPWSAALPDWIRRLADTVAQGHAAMLAADQAYFPPWPIDAEGYRIVPAEVYPLALDAWTAATALLPPFPSWVVATNRTYPDRPAYPFVDGVRSSTSNGRAAVGSACNCSARSVESRSVYCGVNARTDQVALCVRQ